MKSLDDVAGNEGPVEEPHDLDALFQRARGVSPSARQWAVMLRGVPCLNPTSRHPYRRLIGVLGAAAVIGGLILWLAQSGFTGEFALAAAIEELRDAPVVLQRFENGTETWNCGKRIWAMRRADGAEVSFCDAERMEAATYKATRDAVILCTFEPEHPLVGMEPASTLDGLVRDLDLAGRRLEDVWRRADQELDGRRVIELTAVDPNAYQQRITIDEETRRIRVVETREGRQEVEYPDAAPRSIFDLGVPPGTRVIDGRATADLMSLRNSVLDSARRGFGPHRMIHIDTTPGSGICHVISDGRRYRVDVLGESDGEWTADDLARIAETLMDFDPLTDCARTSSICDGARVESVRFDQSGLVRNRQTHRVEQDVMWTRTLECAAWEQRNQFFGPWADRQDFFIGPDAQGLLGCRTLGQANGPSRPWRSERWYDPAHGNCVALRRHFELPDAEWQLAQNWQEGLLQHPSSIVEDPPDAEPSGWEMETVQWGVLRPGEWYPQLTCSRPLERDEQGNWVPRQPGRHERNLVGGQIFERELSEAEADDRVRPRYTYLLAEPLGTVDDRWFTIPEEWLRVPLSN